MKQKPLHGSRQLERHPAAQFQLADLRNGQGTPADSTVAYSVQESRTTRHAEPNKAGIMARMEPALPKTLPGRELVHACRSTRSPRPASYRPDPCHHCRSDRQDPGPT